MMTTGQESTFASPSIENNNDFLDACQSRKSKRNSTSIGHLSDIPQTLRQFIWEILSPSTSNKSASQKHSPTDSTADKDTATDTIMTVANDSGEQYPECDSRSSSSISSEDYTILDTRTPLSAPASASAIYTDTDSFFDSKSRFRRTSLPAPLALALEKEAKMNTELHPKSERMSVFDAFNSIGESNIKLIGPETSSDDTILTENLSSQLRKHFSPILKTCQTWVYLFGISTHGARLATLYEVFANRNSIVSPILMLIRDQSSSVFGTLVSEPFHLAAGFYGTAENCFVFKVTDSEDSGSLKVFPCTGRNHYIICSRSEFLSLGGGNGENALWIDSDLYHGHSGTCPTFENEPLSSTKGFEVLELELWGFEL